MLSHRDFQHYTRGEEIANAVTHGIGVALSVAALTALLFLAALHGNGWHVASFLIYGIALISLYLCSTLYHSIPNAKAKHIFKILDHSAIYLLIAGTYTPFLLINLRGPWGYSMMAVIWGLALSGVVFKVFFVQRFRLAMTLIYVAMGWLCVIALREMLRLVPPVGMLWLLIGGLAYTLGVVFYLWKRLPYNHAIWHLFVLAGSIAHFISIVLAAAPDL